MSKPILFGFDGSLDVVLREEISTCNKNGKLSDITFVRLSPIVYEDGRIKFLKYSGIDVAKQILGKDPDRKIVFIDNHELEKIEEDRKGFKAYVSQKNIAYVERNNTFCHALDQLPELFDKKANVELEPDLLYEMISEDNNRIIPRLRHDFYRIKNVEKPKDKKEKLFLENTVKITIGYFPSLKGKTNTEIQEFLNSCKYKVDEVMKGQSIDGVYCDVEGTFLVDGEVNKDVCEKLDGYTQGGKAVTLWTLGDTETIQKTLDENNVTYPLKNKLDFAGAIAEIVIDDEDMNIFIARTKIQPKTFIKLSEYNA